MAHPPMKSKYCTGPTDYELELVLPSARNEKARLRMARRRQELKQRPVEEQARAKARHREHQATYRKKNRTKLNASETTRRNESYKTRYGNAAFSSYLKAKRRRRLARQAARGEAYHSGDDFDSDSGSDSGSDKDDHDARHHRIRRVRDSSEESGGGDSGYDGGGDSDDDAELDDWDDNRRDRCRVRADGRDDVSARRFDADSRRLG
ncbi:hypothetical protein C8R47DRAFT_1223272 [Mycena vitilis]|nr:hypothetical protein C8R47DRAFT_1223272 [Mycena vitilis]